MWRQVLQLALEKTYPVPAGIRRMNSENKSADIGRLCSIQKIEFPPVYQRQQGNGESISLPRQVLIMAGACTAVLRKLFRKYYDVNPEGGQHVYTH